MDPVAAQWLGTPSPSLQRVANGLGMIFAANMISLIAGLTAMVFFILNPTDLATNRVVLNVCSIASLVALVMSVLGNVFCLATPAESEARGMIYTSVGATLLALLLHFGVHFKSIPAGASSVEGLLNIVAAITFLLFLNRLGKFICRYDLAKRATSILLWSVLATVALLVGFVLFISSVGLAIFEALANHQANAEAQFQAAIQRAGGGALLAIAFIFGSLLIMLITYIVYLILLNRTRAAILSGVRG